MYSSQQINQQQDKALLVALDAQIERYRLLGAQAEQDRRAVLLRLADEGMTYEELAKLAGVGDTTIWQYLKRAREERDGRLSVTDEM